MPASGLQGDCAPSLPRVQELEPRLPFDEAALLVENEHFLLRCGACAFGAPRRSSTQVSDPTLVCWACRSLKLESLAIQRVSYEQQQQVGAGEDPHERRTVCSGAAAPEPGVCSSSAACCRLVHCNRDSWHPSC